MSSVTSSASSTSTSASATDLGTSPILSSQAALYLYTFLVTLILLLTVSAAIVLRAFILRRRHRRMVEEAIRNGTYIPPPIRTPKTLGERPMLHDVFVNLVHDDNNVEAMEEKEMCWWEAIMPLAASVIRADEEKRNAEPQKLVGVTSRALASRPLPALPTRLIRLLHLEERRPDDRTYSTPVPLSGLSFSPPVTSADPSAASPNPIARVTVLISMPSPPKYREKLLRSQRRSIASTSTPVDDIDLPPVEFGISVVPLNLGESESDGSQLDLTSIRDVTR